MRHVKLTQIGYADVPGGGQVNVKDNLCFVGHINPPEGTTILDIADPRKPKLVSQIKVPLHTHSHKVRVHDKIMVVNNEAFPEFKIRPGLQGGIRIYDIARPDTPKEICFFPTGGRGVHRFDFDGRYAYLSTEVEGFQGNILLTVDLANPTRPKEVSRWWLPGQWTAGGEVPSWVGGVRHRVHHGLRRGDKIYVSLVYAGMAIVDVTDLERPKTIVRHPLHGLFTHTVMPKRGPAGDPRDFAISVDEAWWDEGGWMSTVDITDPARPAMVAQCDLPRGKGIGIWGSHQPHEEFVDDLLFVAWFSHGLRIFDVTHPAQPVEVGSHMPEIRSEFEPLSNDVFVDAPNHRVYLIDRIRGLEILEYSY